MENPKSKPKQKTKDSEEENGLFLSLSEESDSSTVSLVTVGSQASERSTRRTRPRKKEGDGDIGGKNSGSESDAPASKVPVEPRRTRGRPPTTGQYVGLAKAKEELNRAREEELQLEAERQMAEEQKLKLERSRSYLTTVTQNEDVNQEQDVAKIQKLVSDSVETVMNVATRSKNLKGTYVAALKNAARVMQDSFDVMRKRTMSEEVTLLLEANKKLSDELKQIRCELEELRAARTVPPPTAAPATAPPFEEIMKMVMVQVGTMVNARFEGLADRLLPEERLRPPPAADNNTTVDTPQVADEVSASAINVCDPLLRPDQQSTGEAKKTRRTKKKKKVKDTPALVQPTDPKPVPLPKPNPEAVASQPWTTVTRRSSRKKVGTTERARTSAPERLRAQKQIPMTTKAKAAKLRAPRTSAVVITLGPQAASKGITYAKVLTTAKDRIDLADLGIPPLKMRAAATGARVLEIPGAERDEKADSLARKLREVFKDTEEVKVSRPTTTADLRVSGLDDTVTSNELQQAIAKAGDCDVLAVKAGEVKPGPAGMGIAFVRCPATAAKKIVANGGRLLVGWVAAQVRLLDPRPRRCYRCLELGHVRAQCKSEVDRSDECHRCGKNGHKANDCSAAPHCSICEHAGKPAEHLSGGKACAKPPSKTRGKKKPAVTKSKSQPASSTREQEEVMEEN